MKNKLYESLMASISKVIKDALNEASIWDMETANGKANSKSKAALDREKNIVYKLKELGIKAQYISAGSRQTSANGRNEENKLISGKNFSEYQTIHVNNPIKNELVAHTHDGLLTLFGLHFVKAGKVDPKLGAFLSRMEQLREKGDYNCYYAITEEEIQTITEPTKELIQKIEELLNE